MNIQENEAFTILHPAWLQHPATGSLIAYLKDRRLKLLLKVMADRLAENHSIIQDNLSRAAAVDHLIDVIVSGEFLK
jgi:hypothetical protein